MKLILEGGIIDAHMAAVAAEDRRNRRVLDAQIRLLYGNALTGTVVTFIVASLLAYCQREVVHHSVVVGWLLYMMLVSVSRIALPFKLS